MATIETEAQELLDKEIHDARVSKVKFYLAKLAKYARWTQQVKAHITDVLADKDDADDDE